MKILFTTNVPSPYRVNFFNELGKLCNLTVLFEKRTSSERDKSWSNYKFENFNGVFLKGISVSVDAAWCCGFKKYLSDKSYDAIVCCNYATPTGMSMVEYMRHHKIQYYIEGDGGFAKSGKGIKEKIKRYFIKGAFGYFSTAKAHDEYYLAYGASADKLYRYPFTSLYSHDIIEKLPSRAEKLIIREELGLTEKKIIVTVGQFIYRKGFDIAIKSMSRCSSDFGLYIIGGKPTEEYIALKKFYSATNIHFLGFKDRETLKKYYYAADLFVLPTREDIWGLVINEAAASGLPIISTNRCVSATELVEDNVNGYVIPVDDENALAEAINKILNNEETIKKMSSASLEKIRKYTFENMARRHMEVFKLNAQ